METLTKTKWGVDKAHSEIQFKAKHLMISNVTIKLTEYDLSAETEGTDFSSAVINLSGEVKSLTSGNEQRDQHMMGDDFFDVAKFPKMIFASTSLKKESDDLYEVHGNLTLRGTTRPVTFKAEFGGIVKDPYGNTKAGFHVTGKVNRKDFGLKFHAATETGGLVVSDEIKLDAEIELVMAK
jgi:polyisoprenoid-binding protein YceI